MTVNDKKLELDLQTALKYDNMDLAAATLFNLKDKIIFALANGGITPYEFVIGYIFVIQDLIDDKKELIKCFEITIEMIKANMKEEVK